VAQQFGYPVKLTFKDKVLQKDSTEVIPTGPEPAVLQAVKLIDENALLYNRLIQLEEVELLVGKGTVVGIYDESKFLGLVLFKDLETPSSLLKYLATFVEFECESFSFVAFDSRGTRQEIETIVT
jgi:hypothetical protein